MYVFSTHTHSYTHTCRGHMLSWNHVVGACRGIMSWVYVVGIMSWASCRGHHVVGACRGNHVVEACRGHMSWAHVVESCRGEYVAWALLEGVFCL